MYDHISLQANSDFSKFTDIENLRSIFSEMEGCKMRSNASASIQLNDYQLIIKGIKCDKDGNYEYDSDLGLKKVNLIEIDIPQGAESEFEDEIRQIVMELSEKLGWLIDWKE